MSYTKPSLSGYNASPPPDDGTTGSNNEITWSKHKTKLGDPLQTFSNAINDAVEAAWSDADWPLKSSATYASATTFTVPDVTSFHNGRRVKTSEDAYGVITNVSGTTITVELSSGSLTASLASVQLGPAAVNPAIDARGIVHQDKIYSTEYLQTTSDIANGAPLSILRFIAPSDHTKIRGRISTTDHSLALNNAITELNAIGGGKINLPPGDYNCEDVIPKTGVTLSGEIVGSMSGGLSTGARFVSLGNGSHIINQASGAVYNFAIDGMMFQGPGSSIVGRGVYGLALHRFNLTNCAFNNFAGEAAKVDAGTAAIYQNLFAQNCILDRTQTGKIGVLDITANDNWFGIMEITTSQGGTANKSDANLYLCAIKISGANHFVNGIIGEIADIGIYVDCSDSRFVNCRADLNQGHGWQLVNATSNRFTNCSGTRNSQDANDTYNQWDIDSSSRSNRFVNCNGDGLGSDTNKAKYGFNDAVNSDSGKNYYDDCSGSLNVTAPFNTVDYAGSSVRFHEGPPKTFALADATPSVEQYSFFRTGGADTYTNFDDGISGQTIKILASHAATINNTATIKTNTGASKLLTVNAIYSFKNWNGVWYEYS